MQNDNDLIREDLEVTRVDLCEARKSNSELRDNVGGLQEDLNKYMKLQDESTNDVRGEFNLFPVNMF